jgi:hypothetical protein
VREPENDGLVVIVDGHKQNNTVAVWSNEIPAVGKVPKSTTDTLLLYIGGYGHEDDNSVSPSHVYAVWLDLYGI